MNRPLLLTLQIGVAVATVVAWYVVSSTDLVGDPSQTAFFFSTPIDVARQIWTWFATGTIWYHLWITRQPRLAAVFDPYVKGANALPRVVLAPIFTLWFGLGIWSKVALGFTLVFFIVFFNVYQGVKEVDRTVLSNARMLGMNERQLLRHVYMPSAMSWVFSSLHTSIGFAVVGAVVGEYLGPRLPHPAGRGHVRRGRRVRRDVRAGRLRPGHRLGRHHRRAPAARLAPGTGPDPPLKSAGFRTARP